MAENDSEDVERARAGGGSATVNVTVTVLAPAGPPSIVRCPVLVPAVKPAGFADTVRVFGALPDAGDTVSHDRSLVTLKSSVPPPRLATDTDCAAGSAPSATAENESAEVETSIAAGDSLTVNVTVTVFGDPLAPPAVTITCPV